MNQRKAVVVGGSISGLFAAALLRKGGWSVEVFERSDVELKGRGAGIVSHKELQDILVESGAGIADLGVYVEDRVLLDSGGHVIGHHRYPQIVTSWDRLQNLCRSVQPLGSYHLNHNLVDFAQDDEGVTIRFENGHTERADLLVAADGFRSAARNRLAPAVQPIYAGYVIWRALVDEAELDAETHKAVFDKFTFFVAPGHEAIGYPIAGPDNDLRPGKRRYNFVWYRNTDQLRLGEMLTDESGCRHVISIPPPLVRAEVVREMRETAETFMCKPMLNVLRAVKTAFFTPIYDLASPSMAFGRVALIGDAAFVGRPHVGLGVTKGAADAKCLADSLTAADEIAAGLRGFNDIRKPIGELVVARGRELGALLTQTDGTARHNYHDLLRNTAADHFLRQ